MYSDERKAYLKEYAEVHKEDLAGYQKEYAEIHKEELKQYHKEYYQRTKQSLRTRFCQLKSSASRRNIVVGIDFEQYCALVITDECHYCGSVLPCAGSGIDRLDHTEGYILNNIVPCCWECNKRKGALEMAGLCYPRTIEILKEILIARDTNLSNRLLRS